MASQLYSPLSEGLAEFTLKVWVCWTISSLPSVVFLQVTELSGGFDSAVQLSVNNTFSFTSRPGLAWTFTCLGLSAVTKNIESRELSDLTTVQYNGLYNVEWPCIICVFIFHQCVNQRKFGHSGLGSTISCKPVKKYIALQKHNINYKKLWRWIISREHLKLKVTRFHINRIYTWLWWKNCRDVSKSRNIAEQNTP